jgi:hypothetical protein
MISAISPQQALLKVAQSLALQPNECNDRVNDAMLAQAVRRAVHILAPCAAHELTGAVTQSLVGLEPPSDDLAGRVDEVVEALIVYGDILEMRDAADERWSHTNSFVLRPAPPSFVARRNGWVAVLGVAGDQITPLTGDLDARVVHRGVLRLIPPSDEHDLQGTLRELGLIKLPEKAWLRLPKTETAAEHIEFWRQQIGRELAVLSIDGLRILDTARSAAFYRDRWCEPGQKHSGLFVARRPQRYGADLWCLVDLDEGRPKRFKDLSMPGDRLRPFDIAWRIQAAFDSMAEKPQQYRCTATNGPVSVLQFFSPLPSWAERHLSIAGTKTKADRCLFAYEFASGDLESETRVLHETLWMTRRAE